MFAKFRSFKFRKKISIKEAIEILDLQNIKHPNLHMTYLILEIPLKETSKFLRKGVFLFKDEVMNLRDSANEKLQIVRRNNTP